MRALKADEIEVRIGTINKRGVTMLLYKNARVDMAVLDEEFGQNNWQRDHKEIKGNLYCGIGIWDDDKCSWVWKWDCGTESNTEKEKGEASDAFKRAGFCWNIGRELYTAPRIFLEANVKPKQGSKGYELDNPFEFYGTYVSHIKTEDINGKLTITELELTMDVYGKPRKLFSWRREN